MAFQIEGGAKFRVRKNPHKLIRFWDTQAREVNIVSDVVRPYAALLLRLGIGDDGVPPRSRQWDSLPPFVAWKRDGEVIRPASANRNTIKALEEGGLIAPARDPSRSLSCGGRKKTIGK
jgi:hypothetical protein